MPDTIPPAPPDPETARETSNSGRQALAWAQTVLLAACIAAAIVLGIVGSVPLGIAIATAGAAVAGGIQITIHIRH